MQRKVEEMESPGFDRPINKGDLLVKCEDVIKIYKRGKVEVVALRGLYAEFYAGEITLIMGPSGCGKTTLLNILGGLDTLTSGRVFVNGENIANFDVKGLELYRRANIGFIFQFLNLIPELTAEENVKLPAELSGKKVDPAFIHEIFDIIGLTDRMHHRPEEMSGGEQQRVAIACALANNPKILLCDEPTGELDTKSKYNIMNLLQAIVKKYPDKAIIIVSHDPELRKIADRMYYIRDGKISHKFTPEEMEKIRSESDEDTMVPGKTTSSSQDLLTELLEIDNFIKEKIEKISKQTHPM